MPYEGYAFNHEWYDTEKVDVHSVMAKTAEEAASLDPKFVNFDLNMDPASYTFNDSWDFHLAAGSPALDASKTYTAGDRQPYFGTSGLEVNGQYLPRHRCMVRSLRRVISTGKINKTKTAL